MIITQVRFRFKVELEIASDRFLDDEEDDIDNDNFTYTTDDDDDEAEYDEEEKEEMEESLSRVSNSGKGVCDEDKRIRVERRFQIVQGSRGIEVIFAEIEFRLPDSDIFIF
ncbi:hypothetical protein Ddye_031595 [Dipteronia dyeriana]|uniref:Uncharacterized protein n=1 Tax=Dipteronia dyeriana TaxID=168575 RepID=A0AAD9TJL9_9ROSI|nr:hypothetical protein Ddye_031595 [Dipteronia dyeriana]